MSRYLPDVNVLLALLWPRHEGHRAAHAWFARSGRRAWATNPLTQLGVLRLLTNPAVTCGAVSAVAALGALKAVTGHEGHEFWPLQRDFTSVLGPFAARLQGYRQWSDAVLIWQASARDAVVATFDSGLKQLAGGEFGDRVLLLQPA